MTAIFAAIRGENFGLGPTELAPGETQMVLFLLGLLAGVLLMTGLFIFLSWKQSRSQTLSDDETAKLLDELAAEEQAEERDSSPPEFTHPWERPDDWWKRSP